MPTVAMVEYGEASPEVRAIYDDIMAVKGINFVPNFWKTLASHPPLLAEVWRSLNRAMRPGRLDALTKEMIALAVSATNGCTYCIRSHTAAARKLGMDDEMLGELMAVVGTFNQTNRLADGYQVEVDDQLMRASEGQPVASLSSVRAALRKGRAAGRKAQRSPGARGRATRRH
jgi:AhpD family alkylhydroperoxidase